jgi:RNA polymerase sigma-B factor
MPTDDPDRAALRTRAIEWYLPMTGYLARRFGGRGEPLDDLTQAAVIGLMKAVDGYDCRRGIPFAGYAIPTIVGEIKRHFRDATWDVRVPRRTQELHRAILTAADELTREMQATPDTAMVAERLGIARHEAAATLHVAYAYRAVSLDQPRADGGGADLTELLGGPDPAMAMAEDRELLQRWLAKLSDRDRRIIEMRFYADLTQAQIALELGVSQMHVSRLLTRSMFRLRQMAWRSRLP